MQMSYVSGSQLQISHSFGLLWSLVVSISRLQQEIAVTRIEHEKNDPVSHEYHKTLPQSSTDLENEQWRVIHDTVLFIQ